MYKQHKFYSTKQDEVQIAEYSYPRTKNNKIINILEQSLLDQLIKDGYIILFTSTCCKAQLQTKNKLFNTYDISRYKTLKV